MLDCFSSPFSLDFSQLKTSLFKVIYKTINFIKGENSEDSTVFYWSIDSGDN
jgi:hypothetical protein